VGIVSLADLELDIEPVSDSEVSVHLAYRPAAYGCQVV
jgi:hypothetical protein